MQKLVSEYGQEDLEVEDLVPTNDLRWWLGSVHVATPVEEVRRKTLRKIKTATKTDERWTPELIDQTITAALWIHKENLLEYRWVMKC
jgi:hypothetical protein